MKKNLGSLDRIIRIVLVVVLTAAFITRAASGFWGILAISLGSVLVLSIVLNWCPIYALFGIKTCKK
jgi:hypothetical protein